MDLNDTPQEAAFRKEARRFLEKNAKRKDEARSLRRSGSYDEKKALTNAKAWQAKKAKAGYAAITWPKEYGGMGGTPMQSIIYSQEEAHYDVPAGFFEIGLGMCVPTVMAYGDEKVLERYVKPALYGEEIWCQLFSEPAAGSDVAGIRSRVKKDGEDWILNGQKVWTSGAQFSDYGIIVARSDPSQPKHKGLTFFYMDMKSKGVEVRPIKQMSGDSTFNEVFFTDVRIPDSQRLGEVGEGWKVALTTLMNERLAVGMGQSLDADDLLDVARHLSTEKGPALQDDHIRSKIADWYAESQGLKYTKMRTLTALSKGETPGPESSIIKIVSARKMQDIGGFAMEMQDMAGIMRDSDQTPMRASFQNQWIWASGFRIAGGTDEILRNIVAERVLGLPQDIRVDKNLPFEDIPKGSL